MRNYIQQLAEYRAPHGLLGKLHLHYKNWCLRRDMRRLLKLLEDHRLNDIGFRRQDLLYILHRPSDCDLRWELDQLPVNLTLPVIEPQQRQLTRLNTARPSP